ncbi:MAG: undecaprenyl-diphosphate phosphatase [Nanoarchaeota archaeon]|nr:undecaprenyl-diphosphate phosphatase [Nanoarchaeota archaeon]
MVTELIQYIILGTLQGIFEWLPISSEGILFLVNANIFNNTNLDIVIRQALFLHLGTFFAALIYFRKQVWKLTKTIFQYKKSESETKSVLKFLIITTIITSVLGLIILIGLKSLEQYFEISGIIITFAIGILLLFTAIIQIQASKQDSTLRKSKDIKKSDSILLGIMQSLAVLPGVSRSGTTISTLLLKKFNDTTALKLSFLMSLPIVFLGNIVLAIEDVTLTSFSLVGLAFSFIFGILTIHILMKLSRKINFGYFVLIFAILVLLAGVLMMI